MKNDNVEKLFKNLIEDNPGYFQSEAIEAKERIWNKAKQHIPDSKRINVLIRILAAACIGLLFFSSISFLKLKTEKNKNQELSRFYTTLLNKAENNIGIKIDTFYVEKYNYDTIIKTITIEVPKIEYISQIVYKTDTVYQVIEKNISQNNHFIASEEKTYEIENYIVPKNSKSKSKKLTFRFGSKSKKLQDTQLAIKK